MNQEKKHPLNEYYSKIYRRYDQVNRIFTLGMDVKWRRITACACISYKPKKIIDVCCGTGDLALQLACLASNQINISAYDFNENMLDVARKKAKKSGCDQINFLQGNVTQMPFAEGEFDSITIGFGFRNLVFENPDAVKHISELGRVLSAGGRMYILESAVPKSLLVRVLYKFYLKAILIPLGGLISGDWDAYNYLAGSSVNYFTPDELKEFLAKHNFEIESVQSFFFGSSSLVTAKKTAPDS